MQQKILQKWKLMNNIIYYYYQNIYIATHEERFTKEKEWKIENKNYGNKWVFSCLLNIGKDCDSRK